MIMPKHVVHHRRFQPYYQSPMLLLGHQQLKVPEKTYEEFFDTEKVTTLDILDGDLRIDLNYPTTKLGKYECVYNLGTLEHVWNIHQAFLTALQAVEYLGYYLHHAPCAGYYRHGIHHTRPEAIHLFCKGNGFEVLDTWYTTKDGVERDEPQRGQSDDVIFWLAAKNVREPGLYPVAIPQEGREIGE